MADGETTLKFELTLSDLALGHLKARADKLGVTLDAAAAEVIEQQLFDYDDYDGGNDAENDPRTATVDAFDPDEPTYPSEEVLERFRTELIADRVDGVAEAEAAFEEFERTGESVDAEVALTEFQNRVAARIKKA